MGVMPLRRLWQFGALALLLTGVTAALWLGRPPTTVAQPASPPAASDARSTPLVGTDSCAGRSCHGSITPLDHSGLTRQNEYTLWARHDPHAGASQTLGSEQARRMVAAPGLSGKPTDAKLCL